jgi:hypothetical protein
MKLVMQETQHRRRVAKASLNGDFLKVKKDADADVEGDKEDDEKMEVPTEDHNRGDDEDSGWDWLKGKTVVLYGDSVLRYNMDHFCKVSRGWRYPLPPFFPGRSQTGSYRVVMPCPHIHVQVERLANGADCSS